MNRGQRRPRLCSLALSCCIRSCTVGTEVEVCDVIWLKLRRRSVPFLLSSLTVNNYFRKLACRNSQDSQCRSRNIIGRMEKQVPDSGVQIFDRTPLFRAQCPSCNSSSVIWRPSFYLSACQARGDIRHGGSRSTTRVACKVAPPRRPVPHAFVDATSMLYTVQLLSTP